MSRQCHRSTKVSLDKGRDCTGMARRIALDKKKKAGGVVFFEGLNEGKHGTKARQIFL